MYLLKASVAIRHDFLLTNADYLKAKKKCSCDTLSKTPSLGCHVFREWPFWGPFFKCCVSKLTDEKLPLDEEDFCT